MSSRPRNSNSVTLFPFLAVLVCAMGALILLLIVTTRRIRRETIARSAPVISKPVPKPIPVLPKKLPTPKKRPVVTVVPQLPAVHTSVRSSKKTDRVMATHHTSIRQTNTKRAAELARLQSQLAGIQKERAGLVLQLNESEAKLAKVKQKLGNLNATGLLLNRNSSDNATRTAMLKSDIKSLLVQIDGIRRKLAMLKLQQAQASSQFSIVPFDGSTGTTRRPIFIECTGKSLRFLPEGVEITAADLVGFTTDHNPLLAGAQRLVHYWSAKSRTSRTGNEPKPYVLLLVRPSGSVSYYAARKMLRTLNHPIGYELIEDDWKLHLPAVDPKAKAVCELAVNQVLGQNRRMVGSPNPYQAPNSTGMSHGRVMRFNRSTGRFEVIQKESKPSLGPFGKLVDEDRRGNAGGGGTGNSSNGSYSRNATGSRTGTKSPPNRFGPNGQRVGSKTGSPGGTSRGVSGSTSGGGNPNGTAKSLATKTGQKGEVGSSPTQSDNQKLWPIDKNQQAQGRFRKPGRPNGTTGGSATADSGHRKPPSDRDPLDPSNRLTSKPPKWLNAGSGGTRRTRFRPGGAAATRGLGLSGNSGGRGIRLTRRRRWGFSSPNATIGFEREIQISSTVDRLNVNGKQKIAVGKGESRSDLVKRVAVAVEQEVQSWGKPPESFYWVPTVKFVISPGGNRHYERLKSSLKKLGLHTSAEFRLETPAAAPKTR